jgi:hypothetical protein
LLSPYPLSINDELSFEFITNSGVNYKIYFLDFSNMFEDYPNITCSVFMFNIDVIGGNPVNTPIDQRIGDTIAHIMKLFFTNLDNVVIYVCDSVDERQLARKRKFDRWFYLYNDGSLLKEDGLAVVAGSEIYNSLLMHKQNKQLTEIILAFSDLNERSGEK